MDLTFEEQIKLRDIARKMTRARTIEEKWKREQEMDKLLGIYKSNTKNAYLPKFVPEVSDEELEDILLGRK
ncbi:hypothetical protein QTA71_08935 [Staphylococcus haemolyticus]|uniref:hypothetical protein n=1 Tax=Staphylococcus haemolyticus TaxID=1283 RepID=UPI0028611924|nr:hypothetical protein [Staphylococcus haemolyticus]MDR5622076.1 hypothetical protein [Staphylococcus haemolyticus]